jgi:hypothetical protein
MARKRSRRWELKQVLTPEEFATLSLGYSAAKFLDEDGAAKEIRVMRHDRWQQVLYQHDPELEETPCYSVMETFPDEEGEVEGEPLQLPLPRDKWCEACLSYAEAAQEAFMAYWHRKYARQGLTVAYKKLKRVRKENQP